MPFRSVIGHRRAVSLLSRAIANGSLPPSLILAGPGGVGKRRIAEAVAQALNCTAPVKGSETRQEGPSAGLIFDACGTCPACSRIARGLHPDVLTIVPGESGSIKIEQVRDAIDRTIYRPFEGKRRVTVIDEADALVWPAQSALLKTLEEPPPSSVFVLVTSVPDSLLQTVRSRCSQIRFARLSPADVAAVLERDHRYSTRDAMAVAAVSDGSVGRALQVKAGDFADARSDAEDLLLASRGKSDARTRVERAKPLVKGGGGATSEREYLGVRLQALSALVRDLGVVAAGADLRLLANVDRRTALEGLAQSFGRDRALDLFAAVDRAQAALDRNVSPKLVADWLALQI